MREYRTLSLRLMIICLVAALALAGVNALTKPIIDARKGGAKEGTVVASATGFSGGEVTVSVTFNADGTIAAVSADLTSQTPGIGDKAGKPEFLDQFLGKTSADGVDTISGATYSSTAVIEAINNACAQYASGGAGGSGNIITATAAGYSGGEVVVEVTFNADGTIASVTADLSTQTPGIGDQAGKPEFLDQFVGKTNADGVDTISGATLSSTAVIEAVNSASTQFVPGGGSGSGNVITETAAGFSGSDVTVEVTFNADGTIAEVKADLSTQTPGIGDQAGKPDFLGKFVGQASAEGVDTIAGATMSSTAVIEAVNKACAAFNGN